MASVKHMLGARRKLGRGRAKAQSGQSLLIALAILFLLGFLGALFSAIVIKNLSNAQTANDTINTDYFAQAGVNYANTMLETSPQGADWRPPLQFQDEADKYVSNDTYVSTYLQLANTSDPDYQWLSAGYTRYNLSNGRFLLKVTYDPNITTNTSGLANAKFLRIDSVGRLGIINSNDPTTYANTPPDFRRTELVAYKPIGIVDYSRFITNKDNRTDTANLGVPSIAQGTSPNVFVVTPGVFDIDPNNPPAGASYTPTEYPIVTTYGSPTAYAIDLSLPAQTPPLQPIGGGSLRSNMNLRLYGENTAYLNTNYGDDWEIAGNMVFDQYSTTTSNGGTSTPAATYDQLPAQLSVTTTPTATTSATASLFPSNDPNFTTLDGVVRDGMAGNDANGEPRQIKRLNPPLIDTVDQVTGLTRYQTLVTALTTSNNQTIPAAGELQAQQYNPSTDFVPATISINNDSDIQSESLNAIGGHTLRNDWLNHASDTGGSWEGSYYNPPGAVITFGPVLGIANPNYPATPGSQPYAYGITVTRSDVDSTGAVVQWASPTGPTTSTQIGQTLYLSYSAPPTSVANPDANAIGYLNVNQPSVNTAPVPNDIVIYASGNVRVRGVLSDNTGPAQHITIVTNGIAYIDGSLVKGNPESSIAILARQYVCVNTTQLLAGATNLLNSVTSVSSSVGPPPALTFANAETLTEDGLFGAQSGVAGNYHPALYIEHSAGATSDESEGQVTSNPLNGATQPTWDPLPTIGGPVMGTTPVRDVYTLTTITDVTSPAVNTPFELSFSRVNQYPGDWLLQKAAILPGDIQIQAVLYAQDDSFFVIPGDWFNTDASDVLTNAGNRVNPETHDARFPFYGQPVDLQISIQGAVTENIPADISDQAAWMQKWGWIPRFHGSNLNDISPHAPTTSGVGIGLNLSYDLNAGFPYNYSSTGNPNVSYLRQDRFGRPLPFAPALPVSPDLLYSGQPAT